MYNNRSALCLLHKNEIEPDPQEYRTPIGRRNQKTFGKSEQRKVRLQKHSRNTENKTGLPNLYNQLRRPTSFQAQHMHRQSAITLGSPIVHHFFGRETSGPYGLQCYTLLHGEIHQGKIHGWVMESNTKNLEPRLLRTTTRPGDRSGERLYVKRIQRSHGAISHKTTRGFHWNTRGYRYSGWVPCPPPRSLHGHTGGNDKRDFTWRMHIDGNLCDQQHNRSGRTFSYYPVIRGIYQTFPH